MRDKTRRAWIGGAFLAMSLGLAGCGFQPVYTRQATAAGEMSPTADLYATKIEIIQNRRGQILRNLLLDRMNPYGPPQDPLYNLNTTLVVSIVGLGVQADATTSRSQATVTVTSVLSGAGEPQTFKVSATSSFNITESDYGSVVAEDDAVEKALEVLADRLTLQIAAFFRNARQQEG
ncbi:hypothetical protein KAJ83_14100 [Marivibrio halodurans]|uniref:LPS-assembly lipoprotein n=1 Tax=Marivibrio halodurans TaxID=2039722 RepID=A0A8J7S407_9PROT|nr:LPS assembly lipoprotein LptE [Marivibrio halodurans]MBP5858148.1 hypothetical protein [Marivibrio halodurans]